MRQIIVGMLLAFSLVLSSDCAKKPANLPPEALKIWQANEAVVNLGTMQHIAIELNKVQVCPQPTTCHPALSDKNTNIVVDAVTAAIQTLRKVADGWKVTSLAALDQIDAKLDATGQSKFKGYTAAARTAINLIGT